MVHLISDNNSQKITNCLLDIFKHYSSKTVFIIRGHNSYKSSGFNDVFNNILKSSDFKCFYFSDFSSNPKKEDVNKGVALLNECNPDSIVAVGGGSVIDMAKLVRFYSDYKQIPLIAIPTTAGTGAEVTQFAVCYIDGVKHSISDESILPNQSILYPPLTYNNSSYLTACSGFDALAQAIEAYWNTNATEKSDVFATQAINKIFSVLSKLELNHYNRAELLFGANLAGQAINITRTTVPHALSYTLTSKYGYPHGHAVALTFPYFLRYNLESDESHFIGKDYNHYKQKMLNLRRMLNLENEDPFIMMKGFICNLGLGFDVMRDFDNEVVAKGINLERAKNTPVAINEEIILEAVKSIRYHN